MHIKIQCPIGLLQKINHKEQTPAHLVLNATVSKTMQLQLVKFNFQFVSFGCPSKR